MLLLAGIAACAMLDWLSTRPVPPQSVARAYEAPNLPTQENRVVSSTTVVASRPVAASAALSPLPSSPFPALGLAARVDGWSHSPDPKDAMRAYEAVEDCLRARAEDRTPQDEIEAGDAALESVVGPNRLQALQARRHHAALWCRDLRSDQIESRLAWVTRAAAAGTPGAALAFIFEGPDGQGALGGGASLPAPDAWYAQRDDYIAKALQHCDRILPSVLAVGARSPDMSIAQAIAFWSGKLQCGDIADPTPPLADDPLAVEYLHHMGRGERVAPINGSTPSN